MTFNTNGKITKASFTADIKRKQALYNRFKRRYHSTNNTAEKKFIKVEATRLVTELRQWCKKWQTWGFGGYNWIVKDYNVTTFNSNKNYSRPVAARTTSRTSARTTSRTSARKSPTTKTYARKNTRTTARNNNTNRSNVRRTSRTRSNAARKSYSAW